MLTRRTILYVGAIALCAVPGWAVEIGDDGLHKEPWLINSFLDMQDDLKTAADQGRNLMLIFEQKGCSYCADLHEINFSRPEITDYIKAHFDVIQINIWGSRETTDFDGEVLEERDLARKWAVNFTPTTVIFTPEKLGANDLASAEAMRLPGYLKPFSYYTALEFVQSGAYKNENFQGYLKDKTAELKAAGKEPDAW